MEVVLSTYPGSFRLPNKAKLWLLRELEAFHLFNRYPVEKSNFANNVVFGKIEESVDFAGRYDDTWAYFNSSIVNLKDRHFYGLRSDVKSGRRFRSDEDLVGVVKHFDLNDFKIVDIEEGFKIKTGRHGEYVIDTERYHE